MLLVALTQLVRRMRRTKTNAYDRFLYDKTIDSGRVEDMRTYKLRMATSLKVKPDATDPLAQEPPAK